MIKTVELVEGECDCCGHTFPSTRLTVSDTVVSLMEHFGWSYLERFNQTDKSEVTSKVYFCPDCTKVIDYLKKTRGISISE